MSHTGTRLSSVLDKDECIFAVVICHIRYRIYCEGPCRFTDNQGERVAPSYIYPVVADVGTYSPMCLLVSLYSVKKERSM